MTHERSHRRRGGGRLPGRAAAERARRRHAGRAVAAAAEARRARAAAAAGVDLGIPGLSSFITPNSSFYRVDTAIVLPQIPPSSWHLRIHGMVSRELTLSFDDLIKRPLIEDYITLTCVSNPVDGPYIGNARWLGASLRSLLREAGIKAGADQLFCTSFDGFTSGTPVATAMDGRDAMLAVAMNGKPLPVAHGFPVRTVVPGLYGYVSACKWITDIEVTTYAQERLLLGAARLDRAGSDQDRVPDRRAVRAGPGQGGTDPDRWRRLGPAQGDRRGGGAGRQGPVAARQAGAGAGHRHLAPVGDVLGRHAWQSHHRGASDGRDRVYPDGDPGSRRSRTARAGTRSCRCR